VRSQDGVTYFALKEQVAKNYVSLIACWVMSDKCIKKDFKFNVIKARTGEQVAVIGPLQRWMTTAAV
jgi:hypothetical protein